MEDKETVWDFLTQKAGRLKIAVIGDLMLDCYYYGSVGRISPEAPVPVNKVLRDAHNLGGAGNVAANLARLGASVYMCGVAGQDENGAKLLNLLDVNHIEKSGVLCADGRKTTAKLRVIAAGQQMLRLDFEEIKDLDAGEEAALLGWFDRLLAAGVDGVIISDYAKGLCTPSFCRQIIARAAERKAVVLVDPKGYSWEKYAGADFITPNVKELGEATHRNLDNLTDAVSAAAIEAINEYKVKSVLVTRSEKGMTFVAAKESFTVSAAAREVYDVSGAGDTAAAVLLLAVAGGLPVKQAAFLANEAAGIVVGKAGTYAISREELLDALAAQRYKTKDSRPLTWEEAEKAIGAWRRAGERIVFTNGCFDILHTGHVVYLEKAAALGDRLVIGLNSDSSVRKLKGEARPLVGENDRARLLSALSFVSAVVLFSEETPVKLLERLKPDILAKGGDYRPEELAGREYAQEVRIIDFAAGYSTTGLIGKIAGLLREGKL
ncbi:MAG: D-glycero-beta-D-manno-heptose-7-phosphate kinase [Acidaminococcales bacterium]|jgi:D-beta-D-heptose 7-phosphate kinase/D-beta-D-heptose 1-phosphate adenosyltransferase|nr:D-glycero-beta-D-manno-heptose-7-phosphate kinase [Acidaminococcales bacterium]